MTLHAADRPRAGFTLLELIVVMWALGFLMLVGALLVVAALKTDQSARNTVNRLSQHSQLADRFRADVARAEGAAFPKEPEQQRETPSSLVLRMSEKHHVMYLWKDGHIDRVEEADSKSYQQFSVGNDCADVEFLWTDLNNPVLTLRLIRTSKEGSSVLDISAALRGDLR